MEVQEWNRRTRPGIRATFFLQIELSRRVCCARAYPCVPNLMYPVGCANSVSVLIFGGFTGGQPGRAPVAFGRVLGVV